MINKQSKNVSRVRRHLRVRAKISGTPECPRLSVFRSNKHIHAQIIDDVNGVTLVACSSVSLKLANGGNTEAAAQVGAGIAKLAIEKGAKFIVSPGLSIKVAEVCKENNVPYYPGCVTPTEIMQALDLGITIVKFFPANIYGGLKALKALSAPFPQVKFIPTGGVDRSNIDEFLAFDKVAAIGGSFFVKESLDKMNK